MTTVDTSMRRRLRWLAVLVASSLLAVSGTVAGGGAAGASEPVSVTPIPGSPPLGVAPTNGAATEFIDPTRLGYEISEFFVEGQADSYHNVGPLTNDAEWVVAPDGAPEPFTTRIQVLKPTDPSRFNGTVYVEWFNVSAGRDAAPDWFLGYVEMARQGGVVVGVSAQATGVNQAKAAFPDRYGSLEHPGDSYSYDIFSHVGEALRDQAGTIFGPEFAPQRLIALGQSQSGSRLVTHVNAFASTATYDAYGPRATGANPSAPLRQAPLGQIVPPAPTLITNFDKPVLRWQSETESRVARQDDSTNFRWWEVAGSAHVDVYPFAEFDGESLDGAVRLFNFMVDPFTGPIGEFGECQFGLNAGPGVWAFHAALRHMNGWVTDGTPPPSAPRLATVDGTPTGELVLDGHGNATGGIRSPHLDVPIAVLRGTGNAPVAPGPNFCGAFGATIPFSPETLAELYPNHGAFVSQWSQAVDAAVAGGFMTPEDAEFVKASAATSGIGKPSFSVVRAVFDQR